MNAFGITRKMLSGAAMLAAVGIALVPVHAQDWPMFGQNLANTASTSSPGNSLDVKQVGKLKTKWTFTTGGDVSARAAVVNGVVYFPDYGGNLWALASESVVGQFEIWPVFIEGFLTMGRWAHGMTPPASPSANSL